MDKKILTIIILSLIICGFCVYTFGFARPDYKDLTERYNNMSGRIDSIETAKDGLQEANSGLVEELRLERIISSGLEKSSKQFEHLSIQLERNNKEQRRIIEAITSGDKQIDNTIAGIEERLKRSQELLSKLRKESK